MIKMIACDMDGTLLNSQKEFDSEFFSVLEQVLKQGISFVVASGNQFYHLYNLFIPFSDKLFFLSENGAYITYGKQEIYSFSMNKDDVEKIHCLMKTYPELMVVICGKKRAYINQKYKKYKKKIEQHYDEYEFIDHLLDIDDDILKISIHDPRYQIENYTSAIQDKLPKYLQLVVSGNEWMDIQYYKIHKGFGIGIIKDYLNINKEDSVAFGDQMNDLEMFQEVGYGFAMENAIDELKEIAYEVVLHHDQAGVTQKLKEIIKKGGI